MIKVTDLDTRICDYYNNPEGNTETFREYITSIEEDMDLEPQDLDNMEDWELNEYLDFIDVLCEK